MKIEMKKTDIAEARKLYDTYLMKHFPPIEVKPFEMIEKAWAEGTYEVLKALDWEGTLVGYAFCIMKSGGPAVLLDYLAILEEHRRSGYGSEILRALKAYYKDYRVILIETEDIDFAANEAEKQERIRRDAFYHKNGVIRTKSRSTIYGARFVNWYLPVGGEIDSEQCEDMVQEIYRLIIPASIWEEKMEFYCV